MDEKRLDIDANSVHGGRHVASGDVSPVSSKDLDETYEIYKRQDARDIDPHEARRVLRKIDLHILPVLMMTYMLQASQPYSTLLEESRP